MKKINSDIYILERINEVFVINDNYEGIILLDYNLDIIKRIRIFDYMTIYSVFINKYNNSIVLYCVDNDCLVELNIDSFKIREYRLSSEFKNIILSKYYFVDKDNFLFIDYDSKCFKLLEDGIVPIKKNVIYNVSNVERIIDNKYIILKFNKNIIVKDFCENIVETFLLKDDGEDYISIDYKNHVLLLVYEEYIMLEVGKRNMRIFCKDGVFINAKFMDSEKNILTIINKDYSEDYLKIENIDL